MMGNPSPRTDIEEKSEFLKETLGNVSASDVEVINSYQAAQDQSYKIRTVITTWKEQQTQERKMRRNIAYFILSALFIEVIAGNVYLWNIGSGKLKLSEWVTNIFFAGLFSQVAAMATIVIRNLFPKPQKDHSASIAELIEKL
ncbi:hypothetical protein [Neobacillus sp. Marseille-QA0830]